MHNVKEILEIKNRLDKIETRLTKLEDQFHSKPKTGRKDKSIKEFILEKEPKGFNNITLAIGYFLEKYKGFDSFNTKDLENGYREAKEKLPQNVTDTVNKNIKKGFIMEIPEKKNNLKTCILTNNGEKYVENNFKKSIK